MSLERRLRSGVERGRRSLPASLILVCLLGASGSWTLALARQAPVYRGRLLAEVLDELGQKGLDLVYSSLVVTEDQRVSVEPESHDPRGILEEILPPLGLRVEEGPGGALLILPLPPVDSRREGPPEPSGPVEPAFVTELVVTPGRYSVVHEEQTARRTVTHEEAALAPSAGGDVTRVAELLPGTAAQDGSAAFHLRGSLTRDVALILDGLELYDPYHLRSFHSPFSLIDSNVIDRLDLLGGGFTVDYGDRHGGFVEISTLAPGSPDRGELELGTLNSRISYRAPFAAGRGSWLVSARAWYPEALLDATELGSGENLNPRFTDAYVKVGLGGTGRHLVSLHGLLAYDRLSYQEVGELINESAEALTRNGNLWLRVLTAWSPGLSGEAVLSGGRIERTREGIAAVNEPVTVEDRRTVGFAGLRYDTTWSISESRALKAGGDLRWLSATYRYERVARSDANASRSLRLDPEGSSLALWTAYRARIAPSLTAELGLRWDRQSYTGDNQLSPRLNAVWRPGPRSELRLALGRFQQSQRIHELQVEDGETSFRRAEVSEQAELSFEKELGAGLRFRVDAYDRRLSELRPRYENLLESVELFPETVPDRVLVAPEEARLRGVEMVLRGEERDPLFWWVSYVLSSAEDRIGDDWVPRSWDQPHAGRFLVGFRPGPRWSLSLTGSVHTGWPVTPLEAEVAFLPGGSPEARLALGERNSERYPTYARLDLKAVHTVPVSRGELRLTLEVLNLTDRQNACCVNDVFLVPGPGESIGVRTELGYWLGIAPSLSILWEF